ncbi:MAG: DUF421 domain-containing protein [Gemmatales bacterium]
MHIDWKAVFVPEISLLELILRGSLMYLLLFALLRYFLRRQQGTMSVMDLLLMVLIADASQNAMAGGYKSVPEGLVLCGTIMAWSFLLDWLSYRYPAVRKWLEPPPLALIRDGQLQRRHLRQEMITEEELKSHLRQQNVEDYNQVKLCYLEPDGQISVIKWA